MCIRERGRDRDGERVGKEKWRREGEVFVVFPDQYLSSYRDDTVLFFLTGLKK